MEIDAKAFLLGSCWEAPSPPPPRKLPGSSPSPGKLLGSYPFPATNCGQVQPPLPSHKLRTYAATPSQPLIADACCRPFPATNCGPMQHFNPFGKRDAGRKREDAGKDNSVAARGDAKDYTYGPRACTHDIKSPLQMLKRIARACPNPGPRSGLLPILFLPPHRSATHYSL